jgi:caffeoyl-CoA O-methyltransferase
MSFKSIGLSDELHAYLTANNGPADSLVTDLTAETHRALPEYANMQIAPEQAPFLTFLTRLVGARDAVEVGTFTGLSSLSIARGLAPGGRLLCCDVSEEFTSIARRYWERAGVADRIELRLAPAAQTLAALAREPQFDLAFIDADKESYPAYLDWCLRLVRPGGLIVVDNVLRRGDAIDAMNRAAASDPRLEALILPVRDGADGILVGVVREQRQT